MKGYHTPVMLKESIRYLNIKPNGFYVDCTLGEGGHSIEILKSLKNGKLLSIDQSQDAIDFVKANFPKQDNWEISKSNFEKISQLVKEDVDGILMDLGISSRQLEASKQGFSYQREDEELDMRMDESLNVKASDLLNALSEKQLMEIFFKYGEERFSRRIAKAIKKEGNVKTVKDLTSLIYRVVPAASLRGDSHHPARRVFQALRVAVNDELGSLQKALDEGFKVLNKKGRFVVITFHSLEDRIVKKFFDQKVKEGLATEIVSLVKPTEEEINLNKRAHSSKLRVIEKI